MTRGTQKANAQSLDSTDSVRVGVIPSTHKLCVVAPIFKGGERNLIRNNRPVCFASHSIKVFERVVVNALFKFMKNQSLFNRNQPGFHKERSRLSQLLEQHAELLGTDGAIDVIYLDFTKAFDKVDHGVLLGKSEYMKFYCSGLNACLQIESKSLRSKGRLLKNQR